MNSTVSIIRFNRMIDLLTMCSLWIVAVHIQYKLDYPNYVGGMQFVYDSLGVQINENLLAFGLYCLAKSWRVMTHKTNLIM